MAKAYSLRGNKPLLMTLQFLLYAYWHDYQPLPPSGYRYASKASS